MEAYFDNSPPRVWTAYDSEKTMMEDCHNPPPSTEKVGGVEEVEQYML